MKINIKNYDLEKFVKKDNSYYYREDLNDSFYCEIIIKDDNLDIKVYDKNTSEEYIPFNIKSNQGALCSFLHESVDKIIDMLKKESNIVDDLVRYIENKYSIKPQYPFPNDSNSFTLNKNKKWFLLYMNISSKKLGINDIRDIDIINIKLPTELISELIDNVVFFRAYHMNKKYWITINLDNVSSIEEIVDYIDMSFNLV